MTLTKILCGLFHNFHPMKNEIKIPRRISSSSTIPNVCAIKSDSDGILDFKIVLHILNISKTILNRCLILELYADYRCIVIQH